MDFYQQQQQRQQQRTEELIGYRFRSNKHVIEALTPGVPGANYRLAVVGDCKMDSAMVDEWYLGNTSRKDWSTMRENLLGNINLARVTRETGLAACVIPEGLPCSDKQAATLLEAIIGAVYLDSDYDMESVKSVMKTLGIRQVVWFIRLQERADEERDDEYDFGQSVPCCSDVYETFQRPEKTTRILDETLLNRCLDSTRRIAALDSELEGHDWHDAWRSDLARGRDDAAIALLLTLVPNLKYLDIQSFHSTFSQHFGMLVKQLLGVASWVKDERSFSANVPSFKLVTSMPFPPPSLPFLAHLEGVTLRKRGWSDWDADAFNERDTAISRLDKTITINKKLKDDNADCWHIIANKQLEINALTSEINALHDKIWQLEQDPSQETQKVKEITGIVTREATHRNTSTQHGIPPLAKTKHFQIIIMNDLSVSTSKDHSNEDVTTSEDVISQPEPDVHVIESDYSESPQAAPKKKRRRRKTKPVVKETSASKRSRREPKSIAQTEAVVNQDADLSV
ncbi:hypothetical protein KCU64_g11475, partial [Aureobasidium melanogenum]